MTKNTVLGLGIVALSITAIACGDTYGGGTDAERRGTGGEAAASGNAASTGAKTPSAASPLTPEPETTTTDPTGLDVDGTPDDGDDDDDDDPIVVTPGGPTPVIDSCSIVTFIGGVLVDEMNQRPACVSQCKLLMTTNPKAKCTWGVEDVTPAAACLIVGGAGTKLVNARKSKHDCAKDCDRLLGTHPNRTCSWGGSKLGD